MIQSDMKNLESAKRQLKDNAAIHGIELPDDGFIMRMLELAASDSLEAITHRNYLATVRRGLITPETTTRDFILKVKEECQELHKSYIDKCWENGLKFDEKELADIALVCFAMAEHYGIDLVDEMRKKTEFNEQRKD